MPCCKPRFSGAACRIAALAIFSTAVPLLAAEPVRLTHDGAVKMDPIFVDKGAAIVFTLQESPTLWRLMRLTLADRKLEKLHPEDATNEFEAAFSPDGRYSAFVQNRGNLSLRLVIRDYVEKRDAFFDPGGGFAGMRRPTIAPDASRVAFSLPGTGGKQIVSVDIEGKNRRDLTQSASLNFWPAYSPDGKRIAFGSSRDGDFEIYIMNADGTDVRRVTRQEGRDMRPAWSPDGHRLAFTGVRDGNAEIFVVDVDGTHLESVTRNAEQDDYPTWHPDGRRLAIVSERDGQFDLYLVDVPPAEGAPAATDDSGSAPPLPTGR